MFRFLLGAVVGMLIGWNTNQPDYLKRIQSNIEKATQQFFDAMFEPLEETTPEKTEPETPNNTNTKE